MSYCSVATAMPMLALVYMPRPAIENSCRKQVVMRSETCAVSDSRPQYR